MNGFWIFATLLTAGYVIYYAAVIMKDMYGKKDEVKTDEEDIDVPVSEEHPTFIEEETPPQYEDTDDTQDETRQEPQTSDSTDNINDGNGGGQSQPQVKEQEPDLTFYDQEHQEGISQKEKLRRAELGFEEAEIDSTGAVDDVDFKAMFMKCTPKHPTIKIKYDRI